ncbi:uncharacterized protein JCM6883_007630 [Sporobolomyces salmoneus]|uniref:uncharacterized protein n=1 Tax=Sporobolomyces salmoneus TaxID=183962 RepID=UPI00316B2017
MFEHLNSNATYTTNRALPPPSLPHFDSGFDHYGYPSSESYAHSQGTTHQYPTSWVAPCPNPTQFDYLQSSTSILSPSTSVPRADHDWTQRNSDARGGIWVGGVELEVGGGGVLGGNGSAFAFDGDGVGREGAGALSNRSLENADYVLTRSPAPLDFPLLPPVPSLSKGGEKQATASPQVGSEEEDEEELVDGEEEEGTEVAEPRAGETEFAFYRRITVRAFKKHFVKQGYSGQDAETLATGFLDGVATTRTSDSLAKQLSDDLNKNLKAIIGKLVDLIKPGMLKSWRKEAPQSFVQGVPVAKPLPNDWSVLHRIIFGHWNLPDGGANSATVRDLQKTGRLTNTSFLYDIFPFRWHVKHTGSDILSKFFIDGAEELILESISLISTFAARMQIPIEIIGVPVAESVLNAPNLTFTRLGTKFRWNASKPRRSDSFVQFPTVYLMQGPGQNDGEGTIVTGMFHPSNFSGGHSYRSQQLHQDASIRIAESLSPSPNPNLPRHFYEDVYKGGPDSRGASNGVAINVVCREEEEEDRVFNDDEILARNPRALDRLEFYRKRYPVRLNKYLGSNQYVDLERREQLNELTSEERIELRDWREEKKEKHDWERDHPEEMERRRAARSEGREKARDEGLHLCQTCGWPFYTAHELVQHQNKRQRPCKPGDWEKEVMKEKEREEFRNEYQRLHPRPALPVPPPSSVAQSRAPPLLTSSASAYPHPHSPPVASTSLTFLTPFPALPLPPFPSLPPPLPSAPVPTQCQLQSNASTSLPPHQASVASARSIEFQFADPRPPSTSFSASTSASGSATAVGRRNTPRVRKSNVSSNGGGGGEEYGEFNVKAESEGLRGGNDSGGEYQDGDAYEDGGDLTDTGKGKGKKKTTKGGGGAAAKGKGKATKRTSTAADGAPPAKKPRTTTNGRAIAAPEKPRRQAFFPPTSSNRTSPDGFEISPHFARFYPSFPISAAVPPESFILPPTHDEGTITTVDSQGLPLSMLSFNFPAHSPYSASQSPPIASTSASASTSTPPSTSNSLSNISVDETESFLSHDQSHASSHSSSSSHTHPHYAMTSSYSQSPYSLHPATPNPFEMAPPSLLQPPLSLSSTVKGGGGGTPAPASSSVPSRRSAAQDSAAPTPKRRRQVSSTASTSPPTTSTSTASKASTSTHTSLILFDSKMKVSRCGFIDTVTGRPCGHTSSQLKNLIQHLAVTHHVTMDGEAAPSWECRPCGKIIWKKSHFDRHKTSASHQRKAALSQT